MRILVVLALALAVAPVLLNGAWAGSYCYTFLVGSDGDANVTVTFTSPQPGSTWLLVPKGFAEWSPKVLSGELLSEELSEAKPLSYAFYLNYSFSFVPGGEGEFKLIIEYWAPYVALIEEPHGIFFSTQVSASPGDDVEVKVALPPGASSQVEVYGALSHRVEVVDGRVWVLVEGPVASGRLTVEFELPSKQASLVSVEEGCFKATAPSRYLDIARDIVELYAELYPELRDLFNLELDEVEVRLYVPDAEDIAQGVGGFVPFRAGKPGEINLNVFYVRAVEGTMEVIALHELIHHFLWRAGIEPSLLWVHEGLAEYLSIELGKQAGLGEGVEDREVALSSVASQLPSYGFVEDWSFNQPGDLTSYYAASYMVFKRLADEYGGLELYDKFFNCTRSRAPVDESSEAVECLSLAAGVDLKPLFASWGFELGGEGVKELARSLEEELSQLPDWCQPARMLAHLALWASEALADVGLQDAARLAISLAKEALKHGETVSLLAYLIIALALAASLTELKRGREAVESTSP